MKILKTLGIVIIVLVITFLVVALIAPSENHVHRTVVVDAPIETVRANVNTFEAMLQWSPWADRDPNQTVTIENDGQVGALYTWEGEDSLVGAGSQTITAMSENEVVTHLHFTRPWETEADATTTLEETEEGVKVTWSYSDHTPYPMNVMNLFFNMDDMLGPDFQLGVARLKELVENEANNKKDFRGMTVKTIELDSRTYFGVKDTLSWDELEGFFGKSFSTASGMIQKAGLEMTGMPSALYFDWNEDERTTIVMAGIPTMGGSVEGLESKEVKGPSLLIEYYGPYEGIGEAHLAMEEYLNYHEMEMQDVAIEEYVTDPMEEADNTKWLTKLYYPISQ